MTLQKYFPRTIKKYQTIGTFQYYGQAIDSTMLTALSSTASEQFKLTEETMASVKLLLNYTASHQDAILTFHTSAMVLLIHSKASYLSEPKARSRAGGHFFMWSDTIYPTNNGAILNIAQLIKALMFSALKERVSGRINDLGLCLCYLKDLQSCDNWESQMAVKRTAALSSDPILKTRVLNQPAWGTEKEKKKSVQAFVKPL